MGFLPKLVQKFWDYGAGRTALAAFCAHTVSISIGICQGYSAILIPQLHDSSRGIHADSEESSWLASLGAVTNPLGSILSGLLAEYFGRKRAIQISSIPFLVGWLCIGLSRNITLLYIGRLVTGIAAGMSTACYTYVSEIATPENRGILQALGPICASFGILLTYTLGYFLDWTTVAFLSVVFSVFTLIAVEFLPESPPYLVKKGRNTEGYDSYFWFRRNIAIAQQEVLAQSSNEKVDEKTSTKEVYLSAATVKPFLILVTLFFLQELSGIYTILFYAVNFFEETDLNMNNYISSIIVGGLRFAMSIVTAILVNKFGRKILCMSSSAGMSVTMLIMVVYFTYYELFGNENRVFPLLPLICVMFNVMFSMVGMLPIPWILVGELFPLAVRSIMSGVVICIAQCFIFIFVKIYPDMITYLSFSGTLATFLLASIVALIFCKYILPETKNKSLQEIEDYFQNRKEVNGELEGYDNKGFVINPETFKKKSDEIFTVQVLYGTLATFLLASIVALIFCKYILPETKNKSLQEIEDYFQNRKEVNGELEGYDNKGFVINPETFKKKSDEIFTVQVL